MSNEPCTASKGRKMTAVENKSMFLQKGAKSLGGAALKQGSVANCGVSTFKPQARFNESERLDKNKIPF